MAAFLGFRPFVVLLLASGSLFAAEATGETSVPSPAEWRRLADENQRLQEQVKAQQVLLDRLNARVEEMAKASDRRDAAVQTLQDRLPDVASPKAPAVRGEHEIRLSAEAGLAFFRTGAAGQFPNSEFRVDEAKVFLEAPVWKGVYFFGGLDLVTREANDEFLHVGELYADFENVSAQWGWERAVNVRVGRFYLPFGEEYQVRGVMDNPLISRSLSDVWGIDEGIELYGDLGRFQYAVAVQNGGHKTFRDYDADKAVVARMGFDPAHWLHLSGSAMRTGTLTAAGDAMSEVWIANGFFRALGNAATTQTFRADLFEGDGAVHWKTGHAKAAWGLANFDDDDRSTDNSRQLHYYYVEGVQKMGGGFFGAARFSEVKVARGYPLVGQGDFGRYFFRSALTENLHRFSVGLGYQFAPPLVWKAEYNVERGQLVNGERRDQENMLSTEIALRF